MTHTHKPGRMIFEHAINQGDVESKAFPEASGQSFKSGQLVYLVGGLVTVCGDNLTSVYGIAETDATGTASTTDTIVVTPIRIGDVFEMRVLAAETPAYTMRGLKYSVHQVSNVSRVHTADQTTPAVVILDTVDTTAGGRVLVTFIPTVLQLHYGA